MYAFIYIFYFILYRSHSIYCSRIKVETQFLHNSNSNTHNLCDTSTNVLQLISTILFLLQLAQISSDEIHFDSTHKLLIAALWFIQFIFDSFYFVFFSHRADLNLNSLLFVCEYQYGVPHSYYIMFSAIWSLF